MNTRKSRMSTPDAEVIAKKTCKSKLEEEGVLIPTSIWEDIVLGTQTDGDFCRFMLYTPGDRPEDAIIYVEVEVDRTTGAAMCVVSDLARAYKSL